jgi:hypothetical protein
LQDKLNIISYFDGPYLEPLVKQSMHSLCIQELALYFFSAVKVNNAQPGRKSNYEG